MRNRLLLMASLILWIGQSNAATVANTSEENSVAQNTIINSTQMCCAEDWGLTHDEWSRYQKLMKGQSGVWYSHLTPAEVLGVNAAPGQEQQHFAEMVAREEHDRLARELNFDSAIHEAFSRLYSNEPLIKPFDVSALNPLKAGISSPIFLEPTDHLVLLADAKEGAEYSQIPSLLTVLKKNPGVTLDIYCMGNVTNDMIRQWALLSNVPSDLVSLGRITLNHENANMQKTAGNMKLPLVLLIRNGTSRPVSTGDFV